MPFKNRKIANISATKQDACCGKESCAESDEDSSRERWKKGLTFLSGGFFIAGYFAGLTHLLGIQTILYVAAILAGAPFVVEGAFRGLTKQRFLNIDFLVVIAAIGALFIGQRAEAAAVLFFFSLAEVFEVYGIERSRRALESLIKRSPKMATLLSGKLVPVEEVTVRSIVIVRPGELIPVDGVVSQGDSSVDEASVTGESLPKDKHKGEAVFAGTMNQQGYLEIEVTREAKNSTFNKIIRLVEEGQRSRASTQDFIDRFARFYTPVIVCIGLSVAILPPLLFGLSWMEWVQRALVLLVIACPCALVISAPVSIASALGGATRHGVLIKGGKYLELLAKLKVIAFDKTRTLTEGRPRVSEVIPFQGFSREEVLACAAGIEKHSSHPLAQCIVEAAESERLEPHAIEGYEQVVGKGGKAQCLVCHDKAHCIGNLKFIHANSQVTEEVLKATNRLERDGKTTVLISEGEKVVGVIAIMDEIRKESRETIAELSRQGIRSVMLTGDNLHAAEFVGRQVGIDKVYADLLPDDKLQKIHELKENDGIVGMVGDGVNDAPALAASSVGIAIGGGGSDTAIETADATLMNNDLRNIPYMVKLGRKTVRVIQQNTIAALGVKAIFLVGALSGFTHLEYAIGADSGMAILVILNSLRLFYVSKR